jgi:hypothetical protein
MQQRELVVFARKMMMELEESLTRFLEGTTRI